MRLFFGLVNLFRPVVASGIALTKRLSFISSIMRLFDIIKFVCHAIQVLGFYYSRDMV